MKKKFIDSSIKLISEYRELVNDDEKKLRYGLEGLYLTITKVVIILLVSLFLQIFKEVVIVLILFNIIRFTGFGFHAEKSSQCLIISLLQFVFLPFLLINFSISKLTLIIICSLCIFNYLLFAPADTVKRPLPNKRKRLIRKVSTIAIGLFYSLLIFINPNSFLTPLFISALIIQAIVINPLIYKIFNQPYNNYKNYVKA